MLVKFHQIDFALIAHLNIGSFGSIYTNMIWRGSEITWLRQQLISGKVPLEINRAIEEIHAKKMSNTNNNNMKRLINELLQNSSTMNSKGNNTNIANDSKF